MKGDWLCNVLVLLLTGEDARLMARKEVERGSKGGCECEEEEEGFLGFHLDCFPVRCRCEGRKARPAPVKETGEVE